jgi:hypothetical protein
MELDGLGGDVYHRVPAEDVEAWQVALKSTDPGKGADNNGRSKRPPK